MSFDKDYDQHSSKLNWRTFTYVWQGLSDFWNDLVDKSIVTAAHKSWQLLVSPLWRLMARHANDNCMVSESYTITNDDPIFVELTFDTTTGSGYPNEYYVSGEFRTIDKLQDFINSPDLELYAEDDYTFTTGLTLKHKGTIRFSNENYATKMWASIYREKRLEEILARFGVFVGFDKVRAEEYKTIQDIFALLYAQEHGPTHSNMETALCVLNDWPYSPDDGTVVSVDGNVLLVDTDTKGLIVIQNNTGMPFMQRVDNDWVPIVVGDTVYAYRPLTMAVIIDDIYTNPDWWVHRPISQLEIWHTFFVRYDGNLPHDASAEDSYEIDLTGGYAMIDRHKSIGSKPYYAITWDFWPDSSCYATSLYGILDTSSGIYDTNMGLAPLTLISDIYDTNCGMIPLALFGDLYASSGMMSILGLTSDFWSSTLGVTILGLDGYFYACSPEPIGGISGSLYGSSYV